MTAKMLRVGVWAFLLAVPASFAGPRIGIGDPPPGTAVLSSFELTSDTAGGGYFNLTNGSGFDWTTLDVTVAQPDGAAITCAPGLFDLCEVQTISSSGGFTLFDIGFEGTTLAGGIPAGAAFTVDLNDLNDGQVVTDPNGVGQWGPNTSFEFVANAPEPAYTGVGVLFGAGLLLIARRRGTRRPI
jgi:hypothetical protein